MAIRQATDLIRIEDLAGEERVGDIEQALLVLALLVALVASKFALIALLARGFGISHGGALRTALALAQGGEFGFVLLGQASALGVIGETLGQPLLAAMLLSMMATPFMIGASNRIVRSGL